MKKGEIKLGMYWVLMLFLGGCAFVNVSLTPPHAPLSEQVLEGKGTPKIVLMDVSGFISEREKSDSLGLRAKPSPVVQIKEAVQKAQEDKDVAGVIVKVNSPGGTVTAADIMYHELISFKQKRGIPVYACIMGIGTSGGYYVAAAADKIYAHPTSVTGSIGIIALKFNVEGLLGKIGVEEHTYKSADKKDIMSIFRNETPEEREIIKKVIDSMHQRFVDSVYDQRKSVLSREEIEKLADGRIYTADQARSAKLIDQVGYLEDAIAGMKKSLGIEDARIVAYYRPGEYKDTIYSSYGNPGAQVTNLMERGSEILTPFPDMDFLYLWRP